MKKKVWIINHYAGNMMFDKGGRHYNFAKYLHKAGYEPIIFCCNTKHSSAKLYFHTKNLWHEHIAEEINTAFIFVKGRTYSGNGLQRILNMVDFCCNVQQSVKEYAALHGKPDIIFASSVHPLTLVAGEILANHFKVKCICEVRDLWPETIINLTHFTKKNLLMRLLYCGEKLIYQKADALIFTMEGGKDYLQSQKWDNDQGGPIDLRNVFYINNGVDLETFRQNEAQSCLHDPDLEESRTFKVIYTGSIRVANGLELLIECAEQLQDVSNIRLLIYGAGEDLERLNKVCNDKNLKNIIFKGEVPKYNIPYILSHSNMTLLNYALEALDDYEYGSSQNKLFEYFASGKPILSNLSMKYDLITRYNCGYSKLITSSEQYAQSILEVYRLSPKQYQQMSENSRQAAVDFDFCNLTQNLINIIENL